MRDGDRLAIPKPSQAVTVIGEVQNKTSHLYEGSLTLRDYLQRSGGTTARADVRRIFIVRADGSVVPRRTNGWFSRGTGQSIQSGDTIVVPLDADQMRPLTLWTSVTQILYNIACRVAAVNSF